MPQRSGDAESGGTQSRWNVGTSAAVSGSFEIEAWAFSQHGDYALQIMQKVEPPAASKAIPVPKSSLYCYIRSLVSQAGKKEQLRGDFETFNNLVWGTIINTLLNTLPINYRIMFYSLYCPDQLFVTANMVPLAYGFVVLFLLDGFSELLINSDTIILLLDYSIKGIFFKSPWNRCKVFDPYYNGEFKFNPKCLPLSNFTQALKDVKYNITYKLRHYYTPDGVALTNPQLNFLNKIYMRIYFLGIVNGGFWIHCIAIWILGSLAYNVHRRKWFWKIYQNIHYAYIMLRVVCLLIILWDNSMLNVEPPELTNPLKKRDMKMKLFQALDVTFLSQIMICPPIVHLFQSRTKYENSPGLDSTVLTISNMMYLIFEILLVYATRKYSEAVYQFSIQVGGANSYLTLGVYPIFFSTTFMSDFASLLYFIIYFFNEFLTFAITIQCIVEIVISEWRWMPQYIVAMSVFAIGCAANLLTNSDSRFAMFVYGKGLIVLLELICVHWLYPTERMFDDETFQFGKPASKATRIFIKTVPYYYMYKFYVLVRTFYTAQLYTFTGQKVWIYILLIIIPFLGGIAFIAFKLMFIQKQSWKSLFRPRPSFGPRDHVTRQLRKQFDGREYVGSQSSRYLARHIMAKAGQQTYRLDVRYDSGGRRSTIAGANAQQD